MLFYLIELRVTDIHFVIAADSINIKVTPPDTEELLNEIKL